MTQGNSGAQSQLGELFVSFGTKGVGSLLKNLNSVSAQFLLGKNAAVQFTQTLTKPIKQAGNAAIAAGKLSTQLATSYKEAYRLQMYLKQKNTSEGLLNELGALQKTWANFEMGFGDLGQIPTAFSMLGLNVADYNSELESMLKLTDDVRKSIAKFDDVKANQILGLLNLSNEWRYLWERGGNLTEAQSVISDKDVSDNIKNAENLSKVGTYAQEILLKLTNDLTPTIEKLSEGVTNIRDWLVHGRMSKAINDGYNASNLAGPLQSKTLIGFGATIGSLGGQYIRDKITGAIPASMRGTNGVPSNAIGNTTNIQVTNNNNIQGSNAIDIANRINQKTDESFDYSQFNANNQPSN